MYSVTLNLFDTGSFIWGIAFYNLKYQDRLIKCLEIRAKIKSVWKINEIFLCNSLISKIRIFLRQNSILMKNLFFVTLKANHSIILPQVLGHRKPSSQFDKLTLFIIHKWSPCTYNYNFLQILSSLQPYYCIYRQNILTLKNRFFSFLVPYKL